MAETESMAPARLDYRSKLILAPMVRVGTLPMRLLAIDYGADIVYCEEIIDFKMLQCRRVVNDVLGTIDYVWNDGTVVFRTCAREKSKLVFQIGTADAQRALKVAKLIEQDISGIDVNMGCPKEFSVKGGMGAALLSQPEKVKEILTTLVQGVSIPVTAKIRLLSTLEKTIEFARMIESCGVAALAVHGRSIDERPRHQNHNDLIHAVSQALSIPVIANGGSKEMKTHSDISEFMTQCGVSSVMIARAAEWNPSIFRPEGMLEAHAVIKEYIKLACDYDTLWNNVKYVVQQILREELETPKGKALQASQCMEDIVVLWDMLDYYEESQKRHKERKMALEREAGRDVTGEPKPKRRKLEDGSERIEMELRFIRRNFVEGRTPKQVVDLWTRRHKKPAPVYNSVQNKDSQENMNLWNSILTLEGVQFTSTLWDKSKKNAEQAAASVCVKVLGLGDESKSPVQEGDGENSQPKGGSGGNNHPDGGGGGTSHPAGESGGNRHPEGGIGGGSAGSSNENGGKSLGNDGTSQKNGGGDNISGNNTQDNSNQSQDSKNSQEANQDKDNSQNGEINKNSQSGQSISSADSSRDSFGNSHHGNSVFSDYKFPDICNLEEVDSSELNLDDDWLSSIQSQEALARERQTLSELNDVYSRTHLDRACIKYSDSPSVKYSESSSAKYQHQPPAKTYSGTSQRQDDCGFNDWKRPRGGDRERTADKYTSSRLDGFSDDAWRPQMCGRYTDSSHRGPFLDGHLWLQETLQDPYDTYYHSNPDDEDGYYGSHAGSFSPTTSRDHHGNPHQAEPLNLSVSQQSRYGGSGVGTSVPQRGPGTSLDSSPCSSASGSPERVRPTIEDLIESAALRKKTSITVVIDNIIERELWDDAEESQRREAERNMEQPYVIKQRDVREQRRQKTEKQVVGGSERCKQEGPQADADLNVSRTGTSHESCKFTQRRLGSPGDPGYLLQREGRNQADAFWEPTFGEIGRKLAKTKISAQAAQLPSSRNYTFRAQDPSSHSAHSNKLYTYL